MNSFYEHHKDSIRWHYRCFDRILLNGLIQPFQQPERAVGFFNTYRELYPVTRQTLRGIPENAPGSALPGLEPALGLVDDIDPPLAPHDPVVAMAAAQRFQRVANFHRNNLSSDFGHRIGICTPVAAL